MTPRRIALSDVSAFNDIIRNGRELIRLRLEIFRLRVVARISESGASLLAVILVLGTLLLGKLLLIGALAMYIGERLGSYAMGFGITGGGIFLLGLIMLMFRKPVIEAPLRNRIVKELLKDSGEINDKEG